MFAHKRIVAASLVVLTVAVPGAIFHVLNHMLAAASEADKPAPDLERAKQEWREQEQRQAEEMVKARLEATELEDQLGIREQELSEVRADLSAVHKRIDALVSNLVQPKVPRQLEREEKELSLKEQKSHAEVRKARQKYFLAEEKMWQLAREQAAQRERIRSRLGGAGEKRSLEQGGPSQRRLQKAERELDRLRRQVSDMQRQAQQPAPPKSAPKS